MKYRFMVTKHYELEADSYQEAVDQINSENEYDYVADESWELLEGEGK